MNIIIIAIGSLFIYYKPLKAIWSFLPANNRISLIIFLKRVSMCMPVKNEQIARIKLREMIPEAISQMKKIMNQTTNIFGVQN